MRHEEKPVIGRTVVLEVLPVSLAHIQEALKLPDQEAMNEFLGDAFERGAWGQKLGVSADEHWHSRPAAGSHRLPVALELPATDNEGIETLAALTIDH
jgi:hypothetical protein